MYLVSFFQSLVVVVEDKCPTNIYVNVNVK